MMKKIYRVWRTRTLEVSLKPERNPELDEHDHEAADVQVREKVTELQSCSLQDMEAAILDDIKRRSEDGEFGGHWSGDIGASDYINELPEGDDLRKVQAEYSVTEEFVLP